MNNQKIKILQCSTIFIFTCALIMGCWLNVKGSIIKQDLDNDPMKDGCMTYAEDDGTSLEMVTLDNAIYLSGSNDFGSVTDAKMGIDVSKYQKDIDWNAVRNAGYEFAFIRVGYRGSGTGKLVEDPYYRQNMQGALNAGVKVGVYVFSQAISPTEAIEEADFIVNRVTGYNVTMPLVLDYEFVGNGEGRLWDAQLPKQAGTDICNAFCQRIEEYGYTSMVYANKNMLENYIDGPQIANKYLIWLAQYRDSVTYKGNFNFWQYSSKGSVPGISGNVDMNYWFIKDGVEDFALQGMDYRDGRWAYYSHGSIDTSYTGIASNQYGMWYIREGYLDTSYTGIAMAKDGEWYLVVNGAVDTQFTGMSEENGTWFYFTNGKIDWDFTGYAQNTYGWWWIKNGVVATDCTGVVCSNGLFRYIQNGLVDFEYTGMAQYEKTWLYFEHGDWSTNYVGLAQNAYGWWFITNGILDENYTGYAQNTYGWWWVKNGMVATDYTGMVCSNGLFRYVENGLVDFGYTGMACNEYGWWYYSNGRLDLNYTGKAYNQYGEWQFCNGQIMM